MIEYSSIKHNYQNHKDIHNKLYAILSSEFKTADFRKVMKRSILNYRSDKGLSLSKEAFEILKEKDIYRFSKFPFDVKFFDSKYLLLLDQAISPYYIDTDKSIWISDEMQVFQYSMTNDLQDFLNSLKAG